MTVTIRQASRTDLRDLARLVEQYWAFESLRGYDRVTIESLLGTAIAESGVATCWIASEHETLIGYLLAVFVFSLEHGGMMAEIDEFFVVAEARSRGIGLALLRQAEESLKQRGFVRLQLQLGAGNLHAREFYSRRGFAHRSGFELWDKALEERR
jgi:GNAT superfamily N-acetyltransferase